MSCKANDTFLIKQKILEVENDLVKLKAELRYWERQKGAAMQQKIVGGAENVKRKS